jgi:hypothetical protein
VLKLSNAAIRALRNGKFLGQDHLSPLEPVSGQLLLTLRCNVRLTDGLCSGNSMS